MRSAAEKKLQKLSRKELLEMLLMSQKRAEELEGRLAEVEESLSERKIAIANAGYISEEGHRVNQVFESPQDLAAKYLDIVHAQSGIAEERCRIMEEEIRKKADTMLADTEAQCAAILQNARNKSTAYWNMANQKLTDWINAADFSANRAG